MQAQKVLSKVSKSEIMWLAQFRAEVAERDRRSDIAAATSKAIKKGLEKGMEKGKLETAYNMLKDGLSFEIIAKYTGLSLAQLKAITV
jgi:predicted transposase/invertase (TIGR01784 family)